MKRYEITRTSTARDLYATGFRQGDEIVITAGEVEVTGTLVGMRNRGHESREFSDGLGGGATEILIDRGGRVNRVQIRKADEIRGR